MGDAFKSRRAGALPHRGARPARPATAAQQREDGTPGDAHDLGHRDTAGEARSPHVDGRLRSRPRSRVVTPKGLLEVGQATAG